MVGSQSLSRSLCFFMYLQSYEVLRSELLGREMSCFDLSLWRGLVLVVHLWELVGLLDVIVRRTLEDRWSWEGCQNPWISWIQMCRKCDWHEGLKERSQDCAVVGFGGRSEVLRNISENGSLAESIQPPRLSIRAHGGVFPVSFLDCYWWDAEGWWRGS